MAASTVCTNFASGFVPFPFRKAPLLQVPIFIASASSSSTLLALRASAKEDVGISSPSPSSSFDVSVLRFTLGIPGFNDSHLPLVVGIAFGAILLLNHFLTADLITPAQLRSELIGICNAVLSVSLPLIGRSLNGQMGINVAASMPKSTQIFALAENLSLEEKENLAWGSYALLKNTKTTSLVIWKENLLCARGFWDCPKEAQGNVLRWLEEMLRKSSLFTYDTQTYIPFKADKLGWEVIPNGVVCSLVLPINGTQGVEAKGAKSIVLLLSNIPNAFSQKDILWANLLSNKLLKLKS